VRGSSPPTVSKAAFRAKSPDAALARLIVLTGNGVLRVTTPSGVTRGTRPLGLRHLTELPAFPHHRALPTGDAATFLIPVGNPVDGLGTLSW